MIKPFKEEYISLKKFNEFLDDNVDENFDENCGIKKITYRSTGIFFLWLVTFVILIALIFLYM